MKPVRVWSGDRKLKYGIVADTWIQLKEKIDSKFTLEGKIFTVVLEDDGTVVDEAFWEGIEPHQRLIVLEVGESWKAPPKAIPDVFKYGNCQGSTENVSSGHEVLRNSHGEGSGVLDDGSNHAMHMFTELQSNPAAVALFTLENLEQLVNTDLDDVMSHEESSGLDKDFCRRIQDMSIELYLKRRTETEAMEYINMLKEYKIGEEIGKITNKKRNYNRIQQDSSAAPAAPKIPKARKKISVHKKAAARKSPSASGVAVELAATLASTGAGLGPAVSVHNPVASDKVTQMAAAEDPSSIAYDLSRDVYNHHVVTSDVVKLLTDVMRLCLEQGVKRNEEGLTDVDEVIRKFFADKRKTRYSKTVKYSKYADLDISVLFEIIPKVTQICEASANDDFRILHEYLEEILVIRKRMPHRDQDTLSLTQISDKISRIVEQLVTCYNIKPKEALLVEERFHKAMEDIQNPKQESKTGLAVPITQSTMLEKANKSFPTIMKSMKNDIFKCDTVKSNILKSNIVKSDDLLEYDIHKFYPLPFILLKSESSDSDSLKSYSLESFH